ncbi:MAG: hypothetical protein QXY40_09750 [Candidatus Methanomethylicia archaeon]
MSRIIRFVRKRTSFTLVVYGAMYFRSCSYRIASDILSLIIVVGIMHPYCRGLNL